MSDLSKEFTITAKEPGHYEISGVINEKAKFVEIKAEGGEIHLYLKGISFINSIGTQLWIRHFNKLGPDVRMILHEVSITFMSALSMIPTLVRPRFELECVDTFYIPYACSSCNLEEAQLSKFSELTVEDEEYYAPLKHCSRCGNPACITEDDSEFLMLLVEMVGDAS